MNMELHLRKFARKHSFLFEAPIIMFWFLFAYLWVMCDGIMLSVFGDGAFPLVVFVLCGGMMTTIIGMVNSLGIFYDWIENKKK
jgi:hypothetical protein